MSLFLSLSVATIILGLFNFCSTIPSPSTTGSIGIYFQSNLLLNAVSIGNTFWSFIFTVHIMLKFDGNFTSSEVRVGILSAMFLFLIGYLLSKWASLSNNWKISPKIAATFPRLSSSSIKKISLLESEYASIKALVNGPSLNTKLVVEPGDVSGNNCPTKSVYRNSGWTVTLNFWSSDRWDSICWIL